MALIPKEDSLNFEKITIKIPTAVKNEVTQYCDFAGIKDMSHFFTECAKFVLKQDKSWRNVSKKSTKKHLETA